MNMLEIERKFLVDKDKIDITKSNYKVFIQQGYLLRADTGSCRVRTEIVAHVDAEINDISNQITSYVMVKQKVSENSNQEIVFPITFSEAVELLEFNCTQPVINKIRYVFIIGKLKWEVDFFQNHKEGLVMAEIELQNLSEEEKNNLQIPDWVIKEVTGEAEYYNVNM